MRIRINIYFLFTLIIFIISCSRKAPEPFSFVQLCDTQLGMGGYEHDVKTFAQAVKQINELNPDFVMICGDLVHHANDSSFADFISIKERLKMPCHLACGNHDIGNIPNDTTLQYYREKIGKDYFDFEHKGYSFIVTNTQLWKVKVDKESELHDRWFKETIQESSKKCLPIIVVGHFPLFTELPDEAEHYFNIAPEKGKELLDLFQQNNVVAYLSGHTHKTLIHNYENIQFVSGETTSKNFDGEPLGFRLWQVSTDSLTHELIPLDTLTLAN